MHKKLILFAAFCLPLPVLAGPARNCALAHPPVESAATESDGTYLFFFPRQLNRNYSGCQIMWDEKGRVLITLVFRAGELVRYEYTDVEKSGAHGVCMYKNRALINGDSDVCPDYADARKGFRAISDEASFLVPAERDPRIRDKSGAKAP